MTALTEDAWENRLLAFAYEAWQAITPARRPPLVDAELLDRAYRHSASLTAQHSRSFYMASELLESRARQAVRALYAFCRTADDIVDDMSDDAATLLEDWRERAFNWHPPEYDLVRPYLRAASAGVVSPRTNCRISACRRLAVQRFTSSGISCVILNLHALL